jgi:hypothetical protein
MKKVLVTDVAHSCKYCTCMLPFCAFIFKKDVAAELQDKKSSKKIESTYMYVCTKNPATHDRG